MRKRLASILFALVMIIGLLPPMSITASAETSYYQAIPVTGFNIDMIVNGSNASGSVDCGFDDQSATFYSLDYYGSNGLPTSGTITSSSTYYNGATYQLADYNAANALFLFGSNAYNFQVYYNNTYLRSYPYLSPSFSGANTDGTLTFTTPGSYEKLLFLASSANGDSTFTATVNFSDGTSMQRTFTVYDWCSSATYAGNHAAKTNLNRVFPYGRIYETNPGSAFIDSPNAKLYDCYIDLSSYKDKLVTSVSFHMVSTNNQRTGIFAVSGKRPEGTTDAPTVTTVNTLGANSFVARWNAVSGATGYRLDVATDSNFTNMVSGYNNLNVGNVTSYTVTGLAPSTTYYYRVRATTSTGSSFNSPTVTVATAEGGVAANNSVSAEPTSLTVGSAFTLTAVGDRQNASGTQAGETRYIPTTWTSTEGDKSGSFTESGGTYTAAYTPSAYGPFTVTATYQLQTFDGEQWSNTAGSTDTKSTAVTVYGAAPPAPVVSGDGSVVSYDYIEEQIIFSSSYEVYTAMSGGSAVISDSTVITPGSTLYIREKAIPPYVPVGNWAEITVPSRPAAPTTVTGVAETYKNQGNGQLTNITTAMEYKLSTDSSWAAVSADQAENGITDLIPNTYHFRYKATDEAFYSLAQSVTIDVGPTITVSFNSQGGSAVSDITGKAYGDTITAPSDPTKDDYYFCGWYKDEGCTQIWAFSTDTLEGDTTLYAKWLAIPSPDEGYSFNYGAETISIGTGYQISTTSDFGTTIATGAGITPGGSYYVRKVASGNDPASPAVAFTAPSRPAAPTTVVGVAETYKNQGNGQLTNVTTAMEYKLSTDSSWTAVSADQAAGGVTDLIPGTYEIRYKATDEAFYSLAQSVTIDVGPTITVSFNSQGGSAVTAITGKAYGDTITAPSDPTKDDYYFCGWYKDEGCTQIWAFSTDTLEGDTTLYAKWLAIPSPDEGYSFNYGTETISIGAGYQISTTSDFGTTIATGAGITPGGSYYVRKAASGNDPASPAVAFTAPSRPAAPTTVVAVDETYKNQGNGQLTNITTAMEYKLSTDSSWTAVTADQAENGITDLIPNTYHFRYKATDEAFCSLAQSVTINVGPTITVSFNSQDGSAVSDITGKAYGDTITAPSDPAKDDFVFSGWYIDEACTQVWSFDVDTLTADITLYAAWRTVPVYTVTGAAVDSSSIGVAGATVKLVKGTVQYGATALTDTNGDFHLLYIPAGTYNMIIAKDSQSIILLVEVTESDVAVGNVTLPSSVVNSKLVITGDGTPDVLVTGLNQEAGEQLGSSSSVEITMTVEEKDPADADNGSFVVGAIKAANRKLGMLLDITLTMMRDGQAVEYNETAGLIGIIIPLPEDLQGMASYRIYRYHNGSVEEITETPNGAGEYIEVNADRTQLTLHVKKFSTYGIAYVENLYFQVTATAGIGGTITPESVIALSGSSLTFTITPEDGYEISDVLVNWQSVGPVSSYTIPFVGRPYTIKAIFTESTAPVEWPNPYTDVTDTDGCYDAVKFVTENGLMNGISQTSFGPELTTTRGMIITILYRLEGEPETAAAYTFEDVDSNEYYAKAIAWGSENDIIRGYSDEKYGPDDLITREQLAAILYRYAQYKGYDLTASDDLALYPDADDVSNWALLNVQWAVGAGLLLGDDTGTLIPVNPCTRAQAAIMLKRFIEM